MKKFFETAVGFIKKEITDLPTQLETLRSVETDVKAIADDVDGFIKGDTQFTETGVKVVDKIFSHIEFIAPLMADVLGKDKIAAEVSEIAEFVSTEISDLEKLIPGSNETAGQYLDNAIAAVNNARTALKSITLNNQQKSKQTEVLNHLQVAAENLGSHQESLATAPKK